MTTAKDATARPSSQHRLSVGASASSLPSHKSRPHAHSLSVGSVSSIHAHRVARRKSMSTNQHGTAAMGAALKGQGLEHGRRPSRASLKSHNSHNTVVGSLPNNGAGFGPAGYGGADAKTSPSAIADGPPLASMAASDKVNKARIRRASEGSRLIKGEGKRITNGELRCETCGKGYKHSSCLTKHLWEHTPEWAYTSKLLISKHQQVQLLEAAQVLVNMNQDPDAKDSDTSSASPAASGSSGLREASVSSSETSPPPEAHGYYAERTNRYSTASSAYSQSYQSGASIFSDSVPSAHGFSSHYRQWSNDGRPTTSGTSVAGSNYEGEDQADLAAAVGLLSCSYGTPKTGPSMLPPDVPPVPPLPEQYLSKTPNTLSRSAATVTTNQLLPGQRAYSNYRHQPDDVDMREDDESEDDYAQHHSRRRADEGEVGMFGMEE